MKPPRDSLSLWRLSKWQEPVMAIAEYSRKYRDIGKKGVLDTPTILVSYVEGERK